MVLKQMSSTYLFGDDAEAAVGHAVLHERPGRVARRVPSAHDDVPAGQPVDT